jgi:aspartate/methionine/tyrosine aminotransferase
MPLSARTAHHDAPNALATTVARVRAEGHALLDLTTSNPTTAGIPYDEAAILRALADPRGLRYEPEALGLPSARAAAAREAGVDPSRVAITASTSEAYAVLFKLLCDPGDEVLVPAPSYPLFDFLAAFENVTLRRYPLEYAGRWHVDLGALRAMVGPRTRAIVVVSPNNPTGSYLGNDELDAMLELGLPIVSDEVFAQYPLGDGIPPGRVATVAHVERGLAFSLSGLSKLAALPQLKLGWIAAAGDPTRVAEVMARLELVLDAYLSVATPVQHALPELLASRTRATAAIAARTKINLGLLRRAARGTLATVLETEGGWYAIVRMPETRTDEEWALALAEHDHVHVHPGFFFEMTRGAHVVLSLLTPEETFAEGARRIFARVAA